MLETTLDQSRVEAFAEDLLDTFNRGAVALMISVGHKTRLFDVMAGLPPAPCDRIAREAGLNERYVREWLGAMVTGRIVSYDPVGRTYHLPAEHAALLTRDAAPNNMATVATFLPVLGAVEPEIVDRFRHGGGLHYGCYHGFHETMAEESAQTVVHPLLDSILPLVPGLVEALQRGIRVLDVGCGRGQALHRLARAFPRSRFEGKDLCADAIAAARVDAPENLTFEAADVALLDTPGRYDLVTAFDAIHDQARPAAVLANVRRALRPGGAFLMQDIRASSHLEKNMDHPLGPYLYTISTMHCMSVSLSTGGEGLGTVWGEEKALEMLREAGFARVELHRLPHDIMNNYYIGRGD